jgi:hypothetical protein
MSQHLEAAYDPGDNKLRLRSLSRLDSETFAMVKAAGFRWAPKQDLFVAPMWTPQREDLLLELCGEIGDEDTSLVERAEERSERFEDYSEKRAADAERAHAAVEAIVEVSNGSPILIGHHSEKHARRDAERIQNGMRKAVANWETSKYWVRRAEGAIARAKYKELPAVRHRRIKGIEADKRKKEKEIKQSTAFRDLWEKAGHELTKEQAMRIPNFASCSSFRCWAALDHDEISPALAREQAIDAHARIIVQANRWLQHYENRLAYERAMLGEQGGIAAEKFDIQVGGRVLLDRNEWATVLRVTKKDGAIVSVTTNARYVSKRSVEKVLGYEPPAEGMAEKVANAMKRPPLCNYPGEGFYETTKAEWARMTKASDFNRVAKVKATETHAEYRVRKASGTYDVTVFVTDMPRVDPPVIGGTAAAKEELPAPVREKMPRAPKPAPEPTKFDAMKEQLKAGVKVVSAPQLFPTPPGLAARMAVLLDAHRGQTVLEPSAGTGRLTRAVRSVEPAAEIVAVEINSELSDALKGDALSACSWVYRADFLGWTDARESFDRAILNPPFADAQDIEHIMRAFAFLLPGGKLVALCANGPRQNAKLRPFVESNEGTWEELPEDTFAESGTHVRAVLLTMRKPGERAEAAQ